MARAIATIGRTIGLAAALCTAAGAAALAQTPPPPQPSVTAIPSSRTPLVETGRALQDIDKVQRFSQRTIARRQHQPPEEFTPPRPNLAPEPPLTLDAPAIPLPDPRPPVLFNKDFPSLHFPREEEFGFTARGD
jgi:hypothetical protein